MRLRRSLAIIAGIAVVPLFVSSRADATIRGSVTGPSGAVYEYSVACATHFINVSVTPKDRAAELAFEVHTYSAGQLSALSRHQVQGASRTRFGFGDNVADQFIFAEGADTTAVEFGSRIDIACTKPTTAGAGSFTALAPLRVLDTRPSSALNAPAAKPGPAGQVDLKLSGAYGVPLDATAVAVNITATDANAPGFVQAFPTGKATPGAFSNLNVERAGQTLPNFAIVPIGDGGQISLYTQTGTHLLVDLMGYFRPASNPVQAGRYVGLTPARVLDTRAESRTGYSGGKPTAGSIVSVPVSSAAGAPPVNEIAAAVLNVTATEASAPGFVQAAAAGALVPGASSNLNIEQAGQTVPNVVIVPVVNGTVDLYTQSGTHFVVDVLGVFTSAAATASRSGLFVPIPPERIKDTRGDLDARGLPTPGVGDSTVSLVPAFWGLPDETGAVMLNVTATEAQSAGYLQLAPPKIVRGASSNVNYLEGQTVANAAIIATGDRSQQARPQDPRLDVDLVSSANTNVVIDVFGFFTR